MAKKKNLVECNVLLSFWDSKTDKKYVKGSKYSATIERVEEILSKGNFLEIIKVENE